MREVSDSSARVLTRMARREAAGHLIAATAGLSLRLDVRKQRCPWCRTDPADDPSRPPTVPLFGWEFGWDWASGPQRETELRVLACERLTVRSLLPLAKAVSVRGELRDATFRTRAVALSDSLPASPGPAELERAIARLDRAESWADDIPDDEALYPIPDLCDPLTLPACAHDVGLCDPGDDVRDSLRRLRGPSAPHFLTPHLRGGPAAAMNGFYLRKRLDFIAGALGRPCAP